MNTFGGLTSLYWKEICKTSFVHPSLMRFLSDNCNRPRMSVFSDKSFSYRLVFKWNIIIGYTAESVFALFTTHVFLSNVWLGPDVVILRHFLWMYLTLIGQQKVNGAAFEFWRFDTDYELRCEFINHSNIL